MPTSVKHLKVSTVQDSADTNLVRPSDWNAAHTGGIQERIWIPGTNAYGLDDEFDDETLSGSWTRVDRSGNSSNVVWTEGDEVLSVKHTGSDNDSEMHALMKSLGGASYPLTIETCVRYFTPYNYSYLMLGVALATGTTYGAGTQLWQMPYTPGGGGSGVTLDMRTFTNYSSNANSSGSNYTWTGQSLYMRIRWTALNTFSADYSPDGVSWHTQRSGLSYSFTPTYAGIALSKWGQPSGNSTVIGTFEYFRVY